VDVAIRSTRGSLNRTSPSMHGGETVSTGTRSRKVACRGCHPPS
jgi:hypothetical protein